MLGNVENGDHPIYPHQKSDYKLLLLFQRSTMYLMKRRANKEIPINSLVDQNLTVGLVQLSDADNYLNWISDLCEGYLGETVLEIGAGRGDFTTRFAEGRRVHATEVSESSLGVLRSTFGTDSRIEISTLDIFENHDRKYDSVVLINVLEHLENDVMAIKALKRLLRPNGNLVLYVPAFWLLYSKHDFSIGHYRRYRKSELCQLLIEEGFDIVESKYVNFVGAIGWLIVCRILKKTASDVTTVGLMNRYVIPTVRRLESKVNPPFGISTFVVGTVRSDTK